MRITYPGLGKLIPSSFRATYANSCGARARGRAYCAVSIGISVVWLVQGIRPLVCEIVAFGVPRTHAAVRLERHQARADERGPTLRLWTRPSSGSTPAAPRFSWRPRASRHPQAMTTGLCYPHHPDGPKSGPNAGRRSVQIAEYILILLHHLSEPLVNEGVGDPEPIGDQLHTVL